MAAEVVAGILAGSLALFSDAAHMLTDAGAIALALLALRLARRPAGGEFTFGLRRAEILSTQTHRRQLAELLRERFGIEHTTLQVELANEQGAPLEIEPLRPA